MPGNFNSMHRKKWLIVFVVIFLIAIPFVFFSTTFLRYAWPQKVWAHKVNTLEKLEEATQFFSGIELDVVYDDVSKSFEVNHPPDSSIQLLLSKYLQVGATYPNCRYWLDMKNLTDSNFVQAATTLSQCVKSVKLQSSNIIVESPHPEFLPAFQKFGFNTSFYVPTHLCDVTRKELEVEISAIRNKLNKYPCDFISFEYKDYLIHSNYFPTQKKICWFTAFGASNKVKSQYLLYKILSDNSVNVLLVPFKAKYGNR